MEHCASLEIVKSKGRGRSRGQKGSSRDLETWNQEPKGTLLAQRGCPWQCSVYLAAEDGSRA